MEIYNITSMLVSLFIIISICTVNIIAAWRVFEKAGKPGWACIIPIYNIFVSLQILKKPIWWFILLLILGVNVVVYIILCYNLVKVFNKPSWHTLLILFCPIAYIPFLGFGKAQYKAEGAAA